MYNIKYQGVYKTDKGAARLVYDNCGIHCYDDNAVKSQIDWIIENCENVNEIAVCCAMQHLWYYLIGISNNRLWKEIDDYIAECVENGKINEW